jgi:hypothetical protein
VKKWHEITAANPGETLTVTVAGYKDGRWEQFRPFFIYVSEYSLDDFGVTYRKFAPGYETYSKIGIYQRNIHNFNEDPIVEGTLLPGQCMGCHTANATSPDAEYIINFASTGAIKAKIADEAENFTAGDWTARLAGALSGLAPSRSLTYYELPEIVKAPISTTPDTDVAAGKLIILHQDGSYKFGRAVNSLVTLTDGVTEAFQKIRVLDIMDMIANDIVATFRLYYVGKYTNNFTNKNRFVGAINAYLKQLAAEGLLEAENDNEVAISYNKQKAYLESKGVDTSGMSYIAILKANTGSKVLLDGVCSPTDAMEDLDLGMYLFQALQAE